MPRRSVLEKVTTKTRTDGESWSSLFSVPEHLLTLDTWVSVYPTDKDRVRPKPSLDPLSFKWYRYSLFPLTTSLLAFLVIHNTLVLDVSGDSPIGSPDGP